MKLIYPASTVVFVFLLFFSMQVFAQGTLSGKVADGNNQPLPGITITEKGTANATVSKDDGGFSIRLSAQNPVLVLSIVGYAEKEIVVGRQSSITVTMTTEQTQLSDVVVVGYGTQRKKDLTGAIASVGTKDIEKVPTSGVDKALQGQVAGLQISTTSGAPGGNTTILIRGISSITGGVEPLFVMTDIP